MHQLLRIFVTAALVLLTAVTAHGAQDKGTVLITGANRGIGLAMAETFSKGGYTVLGTARRPEAAAALRELPVKILQLDVTDPASVASLARQLQAQPIDILINNAGIASREAPEFADVDIEKMVTVLQVNALGPMRVTQALLPNVLASNRKIVANISSMMGSMELNTFGCCMGYRASKAALNSFTKTLAVDMADRGTTFVVLHPGYVKTDMNEGRGEISAAQSAAGLFEVITALDESDDGKFFNYEGKAMPW